MSLFPAELETDRLHLRALTGETLDPLDLYEHVREGAPSIDRVTEFLTWDPHRHPNETREFLDACAEQFATGEGVQYALYPRAGEDGAGEFAGLGGFGVDWDRSVATLGTWLRQPFWGRGYSGERAHALMGVAFERLDLECVAVTCAVGNENSYRAISEYVERAGGREEGVLRNHERYPDGPADVYRFTVTAEEREGEA
ncbi:GNAT family N-acetyltransferase [Salinirubellus salinus]|uniref:GNAT family N-acetyltransferase n=1 Tax=Salinirubellus salinus TaxID=1364945 RepID=A0A9E7U5N8_9EURY|nr:GNAT family protein [Salinirubellus salinus]UWM55605.1 GNAT family N-acetyltransferase [Salinirubellus salinus]